MYVYDEDEIQSCSLQVVKAPNTPVMRVADFLTTKRKKKKKSVFNHELNCPPFYRIGERAIWFGRIEGMQKEN